MKIALTMLVLTTLLATGMRRAEAAAASPFDPALQTKEIAEAGKANSDAARTDLLAPKEAAKMEADTVNALTQAYRTITEAHLNEAKTEQAYQEIAALQQRMRIREYEFQRIASADFQMASEIAVIQYNTDLVRPLTLGRAGWQTWSGLEYLMERSADADIISTTMFDIPVEALPGSEFRQNGMVMPAPDFPGGNLGQLYTFAQTNDLSFRKFGKAHKYIMKILAMINRAGELRINELRDINQAVRLTVAAIFNP